MCLEYWVSQTTVTGFLILKGAFVLLQGQCDRSTPDLEMLHNLAARENLFEGPLDEEDFPISL